MSQRVGEWGYLLAFDVGHDKYCLTLFSLPSFTVVTNEMDDEGGKLKRVYELCKERAQGADVYIVHRGEWVSRSGAHSLFSAGIGPALKTNSNEVYVFRVLATVHSVKPCGLDELFIAAIAKLPYPPRRVGYFAWRTAKGFHELKLVEPLGTRELTNFVITREELEFYEHLL